MKQTRPHLRVGSVEAPPFLSSLGGNSYQGFIWDLLNHIAESQVWMRMFIERPNDCQPCYPGLWLLDCVERWFPIWGGGGTWQLDWTYRDASEGGEISKFIRNRLTNVKFTIIISFFIQQNEGDWHDCCRPDPDLEPDVHCWFLKTLPCHITHPSPQGDINNHDSHYQGIKIPDKEMYFFVKFNFGCYWVLRFMWTMVIRALEYKSWKHMIWFDWDIEIYLAWASI